MSESNRPDSPSLTHSNRRPTKTTSSSWRFPVFFTIILPVAVASVLFRLEPFHPVHYPASELSHRTLTAPARNENMRRGSEAIANGDVVGPEDLVYDATARVIYTGCEDGWIKRVTVNESVADSVVESWVQTGGRPLGLAFGPNGEFLVADSYKGLLKVTKEGKVEVLTDECEGLKFKLTNGLDVAEDGTIYFTDASYKYSIKESMFDILEGKPHGRLLSYDPSTKHTTLLASNLHFANGVAVSPDQQSVVFCESPLTRCRKYYIQGPKKGSIEKFIDDLPGIPDNIHYDGEGQYWIAQVSSLTYPWYLAQRYPFLRKVMAIIVKYVGTPRMEKNGGVIAVDLEGKAIAHYYDLELSGISSGIKIGNHIYCGSPYYPFILRLHLDKYPATPTTETTNM